MNKEKLNAFLKIYTYLPDRDRVILSKNIDYFKKNEIIALNKLERIGLSIFDTYYALNKLSEKGMLNKMWQMTCNICKKGIGEVKEKIWELDNSLKCNCENSELISKLVYKVL